MNCTQSLSFGDLTALAQWDPQHYLNIYIVEAITTDDECDVYPEGYLSVQGVGYPPFIATDNEDGIILDYRRMGYTEQAIDNYTYSLPHELGHYIGLIHPHGPGIDAIEEACELPCESTLDLVCDTPPMTATYWWIACENVFDSCPELPGTDPINNIMEYALATDECATYLTLGQKNRAKCFLENHSRRYSLWPESNLEATGARINCINAFTSMECVNNIETLQVEATPFIDGLTYI